MRSLRNIKRWIRRAKVRSTPEANETILAGLIQELRETRKVAPTHIQPRARTIATRVAAAAILVILALIAVSYPSRETKRGPLVDSRQSAAELLTVGQLNAAYRRGGLEALDRQCEQAAERLDDRSERPSVKDFIVELKAMQPTKGRDHENPI